MKRADIFLILGVLIVALAACFFVVPKSGTGDIAVISVDGKEYKTVSLFEDSKTVIEIEGRKNVITVKDGEVYMESASCPDKLCVLQGKISKDGESIVCLPNKVVIEVFSKEKTSVDAVSK
ncbi:MAG: NusG domain II-containing protein [Lachnospiraceae bacterium]|nr:NusG domain II-containing protein [Lachnospiraceae bacterium]